MYTEFLAATIEACGRIEEDRIAEAFDRYVGVDESGICFLFFLMIWFLFRHS